MLTNTSASLAFGAVDRSLQVGEYSMQHERLIGGSVIGMDRTEKRVIGAREHDRDAIRALASGGALGNCESNRFFLDYGSVFGRSKGARIDAAVARVQENPSSRRSWGRP